MPKITVPKGRPKDSKKKKFEAVELRPPTPEPMPEPIQEPIKLPSFLEIVESENYFASNKGRLTNQEIVDNGLEFAHTIGNVWNYRFK